MRALEALLDAMDDNTVDQELLARIRKSVDAQRSCMNRPVGRMFHISSANMDDFEARASNSDHHAASGFREKYEHHIGVMSVIALSAKVYLVKHWKEVKDWGKLNVLINDNSGFATEYYNHHPRERNNLLSADGENEKERSISDRMFDRIDEHRVARHNPVVSVTDVVLDTTDEDFSVTINGQDHLWIDDEAVIIIADYVEEQLKKQNEATDRITEA